MIIKPLGFRTVRVPGTKASFQYQTSTSNAFFLTSIEVHNQIHPDNYIYLCFHKLDQGLEVISF